MKTFEDFTKWCKMDEWFFWLLVDGEDYVMACGDKISPTASGSSGYVFDKHGDLLDWAYDHFDDDRFQDKWQRSANYPLQRASLEDVRSFFKTSLRPK